MHYTKSSLIIKLQFKFYRKHLIKVHTFFASFIFVFRKEKLHLRQ